MAATLHELLTSMIEREASDLHLTPGTVPADPARTAG